MPEIDIPILEQTITLNSQPPTHKAQATLLKDVCLMHDGLCVVGTPHRQFPTTTSIPQPRFSSSVVCDLCLVRWELGTIARLISQNRLHTPTLY
jgi:hypothetical protein